MLGNRARDTKPELAVRRALHELGYRYRVDFRPTPASRSRADIVFTRRRIAVFLDGCFWHSCPEHATVPQANADYWIPKLRRNAERDQEVSALLKSLGWTVLRFWEHQPTGQIVQSIESAWRRASTDLD